MIETSTLISDLKEDFEGGVSLAVDWDTVIRKGVEATIENCRPETLKRRYPIYAGVASGLFIYYCPPDVLVPSAIYGNDGKRKLRYVPAKIYYEQENDNDFTVEYINGARFIVARHAISETSLTIDAMEELGTKSGGSAALNTQNFLQGGAAVEATFTQAGIEFGDEIDALDLTDYLNGLALFSAYIPTADNLVSLQLRLKTDNSNYYKFLTTADDIDDYLVDGWNAVRFAIANKTAVGSPDITNITEWCIIGTTATGTTLKIVFDNFTIQKAAITYLQYYSNAAYINGSTGALWKDTVENASFDKINFNRDVAKILHYECCMIIQQSGTFDRVDGQATSRFMQQLKRAYQNYWSIHPSDEAPLSYSKSPQIDISDEQFMFGNVQDQTIFE